MGWRTLRKNRGVQLLQKEKILINMVHTLGSRYRYKYRYRDPFCMIHLAYDSLSVLLILMTSLSVLVRIPGSLGIWLEMYSLSVLKKCDSLSVWLTIRTFGLGGPGIRTLVRIPRSAKSKYMTMILINDFYSCSCLFWVAVSKPNRGLSIHTGVSVSIQGSNRCQKQKISTGLWRYEYGGLKNLCRKSNQFRSCEKSFYCS